MKTKKFLNIFFEKKFYIFYLVSYPAGYPVSGKIIGRISGQISIRYNPILDIFCCLSRYFQVIIVAVPANDWREKLCSCSIIFSRGDPSLILKKKVWTWILWLMNEIVRNLRQFCVIKSNKDKIHLNVFDVVPSLTLTLVLLVMLTYSVQCVPDDEV